VSAGHASLPDGAAPFSIAVEASREAAGRLRRMGGDRLVRDMSAIFFEDTPARIAAARTGLRTGDGRVVEFAAHSMKSSSGQLGAVAMQRLCADVELLARGGELGPVAPLLDALEAEFAEFRVSLERTIVAAAVAAADAPRE
jgi:HPt (histidine-containing phosphotransfer) domain-containing protein